MSQKPDDQSWENQEKGEQDGEPVSSYKAAFLFKTIFSSLGPRDITQPCELPVEELRVVHCCSTLSKQIYVKPEKRVFPSDSGTLEHEDSQSEKYILPYLITNSDALDTIFIVFRGSYCLDDFIVDLKATTVNTEGGEMHAGVFETSINMATRVIPLLSNLSSMHNDRKIIFTGHSLGAAVAAQVAKIARHQLSHIAIRAIIFAPASALSFKLWEESQSYVTSYVLDGDFVPFLSLDNLAKVSNDLLPAPFAAYVNERIREQNREAHRSTDVINIVPTPPDFNPFEAPPPPVETNLDLKPPEEEHKTTPLYPAGDQHLFQMVDTEKNIIQLRKIQKIEYFGRFVNDLNEMRHMMGLYRDWIDQYVKLYVADHPETADILLEKTEQTEKTPEKSKSKGLLF